MSYKTGPDWTGSKVAGYRTGLDFRSVLIRGTLTRREQKCSVVSKNSLVILIWHEQSAAMFSWLFWDNLAFQEPILSVLRAEWWRATFSTNKMWILKIRVRALGAWQDQSTSVSPQGVLQRSYTWLFPLHTSHPPPVDESSLRARRD
jgi:hypothetical protein